MLVETIEFVDYNGNERKEEHYFNLTEAETMKIELAEVGGMTAKIKRLIEAQDIPQVMEVFDYLVKASYGKKSPDGREFIKSEEITRSFIQSEAYSKLFMKFLTKEGYAANFFNSVIPTVDGNEIKKILEENK